MIVQPALVLPAARRTYFALFLMKVFETLHPGEPPLRLTWYLKAMCHALSMVDSGKPGRLVITVPPRHLKSITAAVALSAWLLGRDPTCKIMVASYSQDLARLHATLTRRIMESDWYLSDFPRTRISERGNRMLELVTTEGGVRKAVSVGGTLTGFGADLIIIDDCMKAEDARSETQREALRAWFDGTLSTRLNDKGKGSIISIQQRLHEDDLPAWLLAKGYDHLNLPAIAEKAERIAIGPKTFHQRHVGDLLDPEREDREVLEALRRELGPAVFASQYQQDPVAPDGNLIRMEWFGTYEEVPERHRFLKVVQSWDTGMSSDPNSDPTVCTTWGFERSERKWYLVDVWRARVDFPDLKRKVVSLHDQWAADSVIVEDAGSGKALYQELRTSASFRPIMIPAIAAKEERFAGCLAEVEAGNILLPTDAPWLAAFRAELKAFPMGRHDDQVDSFSQFVNYQRAHWRWILTERAPDGRVRTLVRKKKRPW